VRVYMCTIRMSLGYCQYQHTINTIPRVSRVGINGSINGYQGWDQCHQRVHLMVDTGCQRCYYTCTL